MTDAPGVPVHVLAPGATSVLLVEFDRSGSEHGRVEMARDGDGTFTTEVPEGTVYGLVADGAGARFDPSKVLLDPWATEVWFPPGHDRRSATQFGVDNAGRGPLAVANAPRTPRPRGPSSRPPVVYEAHVRGMTKHRQDADEPGTFAALVAELPRLQRLGFSVVELLPVHQNDPQEGSYWGYMPLAFGAVHRQYASDDPAEELAELVAAAHDHDIEVWLDVVYNHTTEVDPVSGPTYSQRGLDDASFYRLGADGSYIETTGCGNDIDVTSPVAQHLVRWALDRLADLGVDGFRFDLAAVLAHDRGFLDGLTAWAESRGVVLVAEPWDAVGAHLLGRAWPAVGWRHWNDAFREEGRGFLRSEPGLVPALVQRVQGSPDLVHAPLDSVNYLSSHDGFTLYDLVSYDHKHNAANGWDGTDGSASERSWNSGFEGDASAEGEVPADVLALRQRRLRNAWCLVMMSHGTPMVAMGDECGRTQGGNNNPYNQDNATSWFDWERATRFADLERFCGALVALRHRHPVLAQPQWWRDKVRFRGASGPLDDSPESRSLAWEVGDLFVIANAWWEPLPFAVPDGPWRRVVDTSRPAPDDIVPEGVPFAEPAYDVAPRSFVILERHP